MPKNYSTLANEELTLQCTLNNYRASVVWYKDKTKLSENAANYSIEKDIIGTCKLIIKAPTKADAGKYSCKIVGREKEKNCFTKTEVLIKGILFSRLLHEKA